MNNNIVFWQPIISPHVVYLASELSKYNLNVFYIVINKKEDSHKNLGWDIDNSKINKINFIYNDYDITDIIFNKSTIHISSGMNESIIPYKFIKKIHSTQSIWIFMCEKFNTNDLFSTIRYFKYLYFLRFKKIRPDYFFSISNDAKIYLKKLFINSNKIFPFAYFINNNFHSVKNNDSKILRILFIGNLNKRKNVKKILFALNDIKNPNFLLDIIGNGNELSRLYKIVLNKPFLRNKVNFLGTISIQNIQYQFINKDLLILPSSFDGWGVVATESIMSGVPIIVSHNCGSKDLVHISKYGYIFNNDLELKKNISNFMYNKLIQKDRDKLKFIGNKFSSEIGAKYLYDLLAYIKTGNNKPSPPWQNV